MQRLYEIVLLTSVNQQPYLSSLLVRKTLTEDSEGM